MCGKNQLGHDFRIFWNFLNFDDYPIKVMPEGPELAIAASYIKRVTSGKTFSRIIKSPVSKCMEIPWNDGDEFTLSAKSRGKELILCIEPSGSGNSDLDRKYILLHFGMSGRFAFTSASSPPKHSHLRFITSNNLESLNFVDTRRFGKWEWKNSVEDWSNDRGPCALTEYDLFVDHISRSLDNTAFNRPLCEVMLDQRYFNGIGNYLRAEIIYRAGLPPFEKARTILEPIFKTPDQYAETNLLTLCRTMQEEVVALQGTFYTSPDQYLSDNDKTFDQWLKCYGKRNMKQVKDSNKRTMWFMGPAGSLAKLDAHRAKKVRRNKAVVAKVETTDVEGSMEVTVNKKRKGRSSQPRVAKKIRLDVNEAVASETKTKTRMKRELDSAVTPTRGIVTRSRSKLLNISEKS